MPPITDIQPTVKVAADSEWDVTLGGFWSGTLKTGAQATGNVVADDAGTPVPKGNYSAFVSIYRKSDGVELVTQQAMNVWLDPPGTWMTTIAATVCLSGAGPWRRIIEIFGPAGVGDTKHAVLRADWIEADGPR